MYVFVIIIELKYGLWVKILSFQKTTGLWTGKHPKNCVSKVSCYRNRWKISSSKLILIFCLILGLCQKRLRTLNCWHILNSSFRETFLNILYRKNIGHRCLKHWNFAHWPKFSFPYLKEKKIPYFWKRYVFSKFIWFSWFYENRSKFRVIFQH